MTNDDFELVALPESDCWRDGYGDGRPHPTAKQYAVNSRGVRFGTLVKVYQRGYGCPGGWVWSYSADADEPAGDEPDWDDWGNLSDAKKCLPLSFAAMWRSRD